MRNSSEIRTIIFRPSVIGCSEAEPYPGWTDTLSAAGAPILLAGLGLLKYLNTDGMTKFDLISADIVSNGIIATISHAV